MDYNKEIDWEQRRYEIAKDVLSGMLAGDKKSFKVTKDGETAFVGPVEAAVWYADNLIFNLLHNKEGYERSTSIQV